jgi:murein DD-endopeptidase MepM/ murein hydrolase activator NlpD
MYASRRSAVGPHVVAIALIGLSTAACSDSGRFSEFASNTSTPRADVTGSAPATTNRIESQPMPYLPNGGGGGGSEGTSGGGRGMGSYQPGNGDVTGSVAPPRPTFTWQGGTPIVVGAGETLQSLSRRYDVPVGAIMEANNMTRPAPLHVGQRLVIPHRRGPGSAIASVPPSAAPHASAILPSPGPARTVLARGSSVHVVAPGETLHSIARLYRKPVMVLAKANNIAPDTMVRVGERIVIPGTATAMAEPAPAAPPVAAPPPRGDAAVGSIAAAESPHSARLATPGPVEENSGAVKTAAPADNQPSFRWPVRGRVIAAFGPKPNGVPNDGINVAVPEGTPVKAAEDGVVAYAGNELKGYGNLVLVRHGNGFVTAYAHASELMVKKGDPVKRGQVIAKSGETGSVTSPQLHFEIRKGATPVDPAQYLNGA